nr:CoB--CoM heterodisulfide reductase iron-sulfur subunit B family protein [Anthocerotibacter panamensis]
MKYAYYPGCVAKGACRELHASTTAIAQALGIELVELEKAACCGSGTFKETDELLEDTVNARNIALAEALNLPLMTQCSTCQGVIGRVNDKLKGNPERKARVNGFLAEQGHHYQGSTDVKHLLWILLQDYGLERLSAQVRRPLTGLKCAAFYGCYLLRAQTVTRYDDPYHPTSLERVFTALGAMPIEYAGRVQCCGWPISSYATKASFTMAGRHILEAKQAGADCIVTPCPLCHLNLDSRQPEVEQVIGEKLGLPILHLPQLIGLALGLDPRQLGLERHVVETSPVLEILQRSR